MRHDREWLLDIQEAIANIERHAAKGREAFDRDELLQVWMTHHIQLIGEAAARLSASTRQASPDIPWLDIIAMRNVLVHHYFGIDLEQVWTTLTRDLPVLKEQVQAVLTSLPEG